MFKSSTRQSGGTLLGLIIGLIIGLGIAVAVAVTIKNTPLPFTNKSGNGEKRIDPATGQPPDPNKPLYGNKESSKEAARELARRSEEEAANAAAVVPDAMPLEAKPAVTAPKSDNAQERFNYYLQAGAFLGRGDAENTKARLALMGVSANISEHRANNGLLYRVRVGPFSEQETMSRIRGKLSENGVDVAVVRIPK